MKKVIYTLLLSTLLFSCKKEDIKPNNNTPTNTEHIITFNVSTPVHNYVTVNLNGITNEYYGTEHSLEDIKVNKGETITIISENYINFILTTGGTIKYPHYTQLDVYVDNKLVFSKGASEPVTFEKTF